MRRLQCRRLTADGLRHVREPKQMEPVPLLRTLLRMLSLVLFAVAMVAAILDVTRSIADSQLVLTPLVDDWNRLNPQSLIAVQTWTTETLHRFVWDPVLVTLLRMPSWTFFALLAVLFALAARRRRSRWQENFGA